MITNETAIHLKLCSLNRNIQRQPAVEPFHVPVFMRLVRLLKLQYNKAVKFIYQNYKFNFYSSGKILQKKQFLYFLTFQQPRINFFKIMLHHWRKKVNTNQNFQSFFYRRNVKRTPFLFVFCKMCNTCMFLVAINNVFCFSQPPITALPAEMAKLDLISQKAGLFIMSHLFLTEVRKDEPGSKLL